MDIEWEDPPETRNRTTKWGLTIQFVAALKERPGEWAKYPTVYTSGGSTTRLAREHLGTEWKARRNDEGRYTYYARYIGENGEHA